jgi:hypothetical protein
MPRLLRPSLILALTLHLAACGRDEPAPTDSNPAEKTAREPPQALPSATTSYERAQRLLISSNTLRFEAEHSDASGQTQYLSGVRQGLDHYFTVRTLPTPDQRYDGTWLLQGGRYLRESEPGRFEHQISPPTGHEAISAALAALPSSDTALLPADGSVETIGGSPCTLRAVDLSQLAAIAAAYRSLEVCIAESAGQILHLRAAGADGSRISATFSGYGEAVTIPDAGVKAWWQEYPMR